MNWLTNFVKPKLSSLVKRRNVPEKLWNNCISCGNMIHHKDLKENLYVCINCNYHFRMSCPNIHPPHNHIATCVQLLPL